MNTFPSIHNLVPAESGGPIARMGFDYQDKIAAHFCVSMLHSSEITQVWCETHDDVTLILQRNEREEVEFVQVKDLELGKFWSIAELCKRDKGVVGTSILEKSLKHDCVEEPCWFRLVTSLPTNQELTVLTLPFTSPLRDGFEPSHFDKLKKNISAKLPDVKSPKGNDYEYWLKRVSWQIETEEQIDTQNIMNIKRFAENREINIGIENIKNDVYPQILDKVRSAAEIDWKISPNDKQICKNTFVTWLEKTLQERVSGKKIWEKMSEKAKLPEDYIITALEERRLYRKEILTPGFLDISSREEMEGEIFTTLGQLRLQLDSGELEGGLPFYRLCQKTISQLHDEIGKGIHLYIFNGCMHDITDRCGHRYHREG